MEKAVVSKATLGRLPEYLRILKELDPDKVTHISATTVSKMLGLGEVQVRKDLAAVCDGGRPRMGYSTPELIDNIERCLCRGTPTPAVLVGAGKLGQALLQYDEFERFGVKLVAAFDSNDRAIDLGGKTVVLPMNSFGEFCKKERIRLGIITVGKGSAQEVCDSMIGCGIKAVWNFAPCKLKVPEGILLHNENLALSLAYLNNQLCNQNPEDTTWKPKTIQ